MTKKDLHLILIILFAAISFFYIRDIYEFRKISALQKQATTYKLISHLNSEKLFTNSQDGSINLENIEYRPTIFFQKKSTLDDEINISILRKLQNKFGNKILIIECLKDKSQYSEFLSFYDKQLGNENFTNLRDRDFSVLFSNSEPVYFQNDQYIEMENYISSAIDSNEFDGNFPIIDLTKNIKTYLKSPSYILYQTNNSYFKNRKAKKPLLFISNSGNNNILISLASGKIIDQIGGGEESAKNGNFFEVKLNMPRGLLYDKKKNLLYIADAANNTIKVADLRKKTLSILIGSGKIGNKITQKQRAKNADLFFPHGLSFYDNQKYIIFSNSGTKQLIKYDRKNKTISPLLTPEESKKIIHPTKIYNIKGKIYVLDQMRYIKTINKELKVKTILTPSRSHVISDFIIQDSAVFFSDSKSKAIFKYELNKNNIILTKAKLYKQLNSSPNSIESVINKIYIASDEISYFDRVKDSKLQKQKITPTGNSFSNLTTSNIILKIPNNITKISSQQAKVIIPVDRGCRIENSSLTFFNFFQYDQKYSSIKLLKQKKIFSVKKQNIINLPQMNIDDIYLIHGSIYCCNDNQQHQCQIKEISKLFHATPEGKKLYKIQF